MTSTIRQVLRMDRTLSLEEIYAEIRKKRVLTPQQEKITFGQPNFQHMVRSALSHLVKEGEAIRVSKGEYKKALR